MRRIRLSRHTLSYADGMVLHTASSGAVPALDELRLVVWCGDTLEACGATRLNIAYLTQIPVEDLLAATLAVFDATDWSAGWPGFVARLDAAFPGLAAPVRMLFEIAAADAQARKAGLPLSVALGGGVAASWPTNQTLFVTDDATLLARATRYLARGFTELKLRVGAGPPEDDVRRANALLALPGIRLSADANGAWNEAQAAPILAALAGLDVIEQPIPPGDWAAIGRVSALSPVPVMLDESLSDMAAIDRLIATRAAPLGHLKLAKLGGLDRLMAAGRALTGAGIDVMVGQMNEGAVSTLAAAHAAVALGTVKAELYGADGLADDPAGPIGYNRGHIELPPGPGLGLTRHAETGITLREQSI